MCSSDLGDRDRHVLIIHIRLTDVHVQRVPVGGVVRSVERVGSSYFYPDHPGHFGNVRVVTTLDTPVGACVVEQIATLTTRRIRNALKPGERVETGQRMGSILLGSTAVLRVPRAEVRLEPSPGRRVYAGETILARFSPP